MKQRQLTLISVALTSMGLMVGCGGGGGSNDTSAVTPPVVPPVSTTISGTAATGAPIQGQVFAIDVNGKISPAATVSATGAYTVNVAGLSAPYLLTITGMSGGRQVALTSVGTTPGQTVNITPLTDLIVSSASGVSAGADLVETCTPVSGSVAAACLNALKAATTGTKLKDSAQQVTTMIAPLNTTGTDPLNGSFAADGSGLDGVLDRLLFTSDDTGMATVSLVSTQTIIGQQQASGTIAVTPPNANQLRSAETVAKALPEISACLRSFSALYPSTGFQAPTSAQVAPFIDDSFMAWNQTKSSVIDIFTSGQTPAIAGFTVKALGLARSNMSPLSAAEISVMTDPNVSNKVKTIIDARAQGGAPVLLDNSGNATSAWVRLELFGEVSDHKFVKGTAYTGCAGGWRWAGTQRIEMHMAARVVRDEAQGKISRERAFHIERKEVADAVAGGMPDVDTVDIRGPGLVVYNGTPATPAGDNTKLTLTRSPDLFINNYVVNGTGKSFYGDKESLLSCKDVADSTEKPAVGTPCIDEKKVGPGTIYIWALKQSGTGKVIQAFPFEVHAVPLSKTFVQANASHIFATITAVNPASVEMINTAIGAASGDQLDGMFSFNFTLSPAYGALADNCNLALIGTVGNYLLRAEANAIGQTTKCNFANNNLNSGSLQRPADKIATAWVSMATAVLGNQATTFRQLK